MPDPVIEGQDPTPTPVEGGNNPQGTPPPGDNPAPDSGGDPSPGAANPLNSDGGEPPAGTPDPTPAEGGGEGGEPPAAPWYQGDQLPEDWREQIAGEDSKTLNMLKRVTDLPALVKNYVEAQETIRKGQNTGPEGPPEDPEKLAAWRTENGIPESPDKYELDTDDGLVISDEDRKDIQPLLETFHGMNLNNEQASALVNQYYKMESLQADRLQAQDYSDQNVLKETLEKQWGGEFETNMNLVKTLIAQEFPADIADDLIGARLANGKGLFNDVGVMAAFAKMARIMNPTAALVPSGHNPMQTLNDRIKELEGRMGTKEWYKDAAAQKEYQDLLEARESLNTRHGG